MGLLAVTFVPAELGLAWATGQMSDLELWKHPETSKGTCLWVAEMEGKWAWRELARLVRMIPPQQLTFRTAIPSMERRIARYGACVAYDELSGAARYWGEGEQLQVFLRSLNKFPACASI